MSMPGLPAGEPATVLQTAAVLDWLRTHAPAGAHLHLDSRRVGRGDVFVAVPGRRQDGRAFLAAAAAQGASCALAERAGFDGQAPLPVLPVDGLAGHLGALAAAYYGEPGARLLAIGVTGTNGKTSCSHWIAQALDACGLRCGVIGTVGSGLVGAALDEAALTTPDAVSLQRVVQGFAAAGARALTMEVSSIGLDQRRVDGMPFAIALFTNLTRDHLDYHGSMERYEAAKALLFDWPTLRHAVINLDDAAGLRLVARLAGREHVAVTGYSTRQAPPVAGLARRLDAVAIATDADGLAFTVRDDGQERVVRTALVGQFNAANLLGVLGCLLAAGIGFERACDALPRLAPPPGRMQRVGDAGGPLAVVDYAHTPDAIAQALAALRPLARARGGALWIVFGAGGDRDPGKRAPMGAAAACGADRIVITSDNPRGEDPAAIIAAVAAGVPASLVARRVVDRGEAIAFALAQADARDVVLIAGKGHEATQEIAGRKLPFSDVERARAVLAVRHAAGMPA